MPLLRTENLEVEAFYPRWRHPAALLRSINLDVPEHRVTAILGPSGSGKTILARAISALLPPNVTVSGGTLYYKGLPVEGKNHRKLVGREIFYVAQDPEVLFNPRIKIKPQLLECAAVPKEWWNQMLTDLGFQPDQVSRVLASYPWELSSGQLQRCLTAMAIGMKPRLLILDEPMSLLDRKTQDEIVQLVKSLTQDFGFTILLITHNRELAEKLSHFRYDINEGQLTNQE